MDDSGTDQFVFEPRKMSSLESLSISTVSCGENFTIVSCEGGLEVYSCGDGSDGKLGHPDVVHETFPMFRRIRALDDDKRPKSDGSIIKLVSGKNFSLAVTQNGSVYSFGSGQFGHLGHQEHKDRKCPKKVSALRQMEIDVDLGMCLFLLWFTQTC